MARNPQNFTNILPPDAAYPSGRIKDDPGDGTGTPVDEATNGDYLQFFAKIMRDSSFAYNNQPDSYTAGYQLVGALDDRTLYKQATKDPYKEYLDIVNMPITLISGSTGSWALSYVFAELNLIASSSTIIGTFAENTRQGVPVRFMFGTGSGSFNLVLNSTLVGALPRIFVTGTEAVDTPFIPVVNQVYEAIRLGTYWKLRAV